MLLDYEHRKSETFLYSSGMDILLSWGKAYMFYPHDTGFISEIEDEWRALCEKADMTILLNSGLEKLTEDIEEALSFLHDHSIPEFDGEDAAKLRIALKILDNGVLLSEAARNFPEQDRFPKDFQRGTDRLLRQITIDQAPSYIRLISLNDWRQEIRVHIPEQHLFLFPWYDEWADLPSDTLDILIENWNEIVRGNFECSEMDAETLNALINELSNDRSLVNHIREEARFATLLPRAIEKSFALRLLLMSDAEAGNHLVSEEVDEKGLLACACHIIRRIKDKLRSEEERLDGIFRAAFCGPLLDESERMNLFTRVEDDLKSLDVSSLRSGSVLENLCQWSQGKIANEAFSRGLFERWGNDLKGAVKKVVKPVPEEAAVFLRAVRELEHAQIESKIENLWERIKSSCHSAMVSMKGPRRADGMLGPADDESEAKARFESQEGNMIELPLVVKGKKKKKKLKFFRDVDKLMRFIAFLNDVEFYYVNGVYKVREEAEEMIHSEAERCNRANDSQNTLPHNDYEYVVIGVSMNKESLDKFFAGQELHPDEISKIYWIKYEPKETQ